MGAYVFWTMQGISILGLSLAMMSLGVCGLQEATEVDGGPNVVFNTNFREGANALFNLTLEDAQTKTIQETVIDIAKKSITMEKYSPRKKPYALKKKNFLKKNETRKVREKRHVSEEFRIPILPQLFTGNDEATDICERHEALHMDGECYEILSQGPCEDDEYVVIDEHTTKGICVPRLCSPDRVFVFEDQKCHDPFEKEICPPGRQLTTSLYGTPVCICPDGTYEEEEDSDDDDVCQPLLGRIEDCPTGYVFWFDSFKNRPSCLPDPCSGLNSEKGLNEMPYVPSEFDGKCYQVGRELPQCPSETFYTMSFKSLKGICASLEDAGYLVTDDDSDNYFRHLYGDPLPNDNSSNIIIPHHFHSKKNPQDQIRLIEVDEEWVEIRGSKDPQDQIRLIEVDEEWVEIRGSKDPSSIGYNPNTFSNKVGNGKLIDNLKKKTGYRKQNKKLTYKKPTKINKRTEHDEENEESEDEGSRSRQKRDSFHCNSPSTVYEPGLAGCKAGAARAVNRKCRDSILPNRRPLSRPRRNVRVQPPVPTCPKRYRYSIRRRCVPKNERTQDRLLSQGLG